MELTELLPRFLVAFSLATLLAVRGYKKRSLNRGGAIAAFLVGIITFSSSTRAGVLLIAFYQSSSSLTKFKAQDKEKLDTSSEDAAGGRGASQVFACSLIATMIAAVNVILFGFGSDDTLCDSVASTSVVSFLNQRTLMCGMIAHYACCAGDTWASELGILDPYGWPRLVTNPLRKCPPGTNGCVSVVGTFASLAGGLFIGIIAYLSGQSGDGLVALGGLGAIAGLGGSLLDSLLGATCQVTRYDDDRKIVVASGGRVICGYDILTNVQVNIVSVAVTTLIAMYIGPSLLC